MDDNMKIGAKGEALDGGLLARIIKQRRDDAQEGSKKGASLATGVDRVDVSIGLAIQDELNPQEILAARSRRVDELKELVANGQYKPSSQAVAAALLENITYEIMTSGRDE